MFPTVETRWFYPGPIPPDVLAWYHHGERAPEAQPTRVDYYLRLANNDDLGIKLREGRIEIKQRAAHYGVERLHERVHGLVEGWRKWSFGVNDIGSGIGNIGWIAVRKARRLRHYLVTDDGNIVARNSTEMFTQGCNIELAEVTLHGETWWSLAFETFGPEATLISTFTCVTGHVLQGNIVPHLNAEHSYGYAHWLNTACKRAN